MSLDRRSFLKRVAGQTAALTAADFLTYFMNTGMPFTSRAVARAADQSREADDPHFLIYWFLEGGWESYDMFSPLMTDNNVIHRLPDISTERYRILEWNDKDHSIYQNSGITYGYLARPGQSLFPDMAVVSSMHTGEFHSGDRLRAHMGHYDFAIDAEREPDERSVMQAFAEVYGHPYVLPNLSWHYWLADGELNELQFTGRKGYCAELGPPQAHTIYAGTPSNFRQFLMRMKSEASDPVNQQVQTFLESADHAAARDSDLEIVQSYNSARQIYQHLAQSGMKLDQSLLSRLFTDPALKESFKIKPSDELITYTSVNGNKARSKFSPSVNTQAMMTYELMRAGLSCAFWIESRNIRLFDSHYSRGALWRPDGTPVGQPRQIDIMQENLWEPLLTLVDLLKKTQYGHTGRSLFDHTTIVLTSEFGRTIHGDVDEILKMKGSDDDKKKMIGDQDISQHWKVTSAAFLGGRVQGGRQYGKVGSKTMMAIPLLPDGSLDPAYNADTGELITGRKENPRAAVPDHGDIYATALYLAGINPAGHGRNQRPPLRYIKRA
jgi:hypothetical protein